VVKQLKLADVRKFNADYGLLPDLAAVDFDRDVVFTWNGTTSGVRVPNADFIPADRKGLTICDATSAAFAQDLDFSKLDVTTFSWQKVLGGEGGHGVIILSPRAVERLTTYVPAWPLPKIFRMTSGGKLIEGIFVGETINTPSMLCVEDYIDALKWAKSIGGLEALIARADANAKVIFDFIEKNDWIANLAVDPATRSNTSVCVKIVDPEVTALDADAQAAFAKGIASILEKQGVAYDIGAYRDAPAGLRIWAGATIETADMAALMPWLSFAYETQKASLAKAAA
jgi:phosphoserine aminotransferase